MFRHPCYYQHRSHRATVNFLDSSAILRVDMGVPNRDYVKALLKSLWNPCPFGLPDNFDRSSYTC